ncbi:hypothetical protein BC936DRAFT_149288 [Jimgerdemannia flammicorona]|uniref:Uncharacterized protein n=1 Tax=Jimgerdemannia flammicorona TaxID=994334 RepID=A0A433D163_9FUNG|nr:hypothetical protein BC936DRAFT_149288 [Jimgerdemannia flammicorona]
MDRVPFEPLSRRNGTSLSSKHFDRIRRESEEIVGGALGMIFEFLADGPRMMYVVRVAQHKKLSYYKRYNWDLNTSKLIFEKLLKHYPTIRRELGAEKAEDVVAMRVIVRNGGAHKSQCTNSYVAAELYLDRKIAMWAENIGGKCQRDDGKRLSGASLVRMTERGMERMEVALREEWKLEFELGELTFTEPEKIKELIYSASVDACAGVLEKLKKETQSQFMSKLRDFLIVEGGDGNFMDWGSDAEKVFRCIHFMWKNYKKAHRERTIVYSNASLEPLNLLQGYFANLASCEWGDAFIQYTASYMALCLARMAGEEGVSAAEKLKKVDELIGKNMALSGYRRIYNM